MPPATGLRPERASRAALGVSSAAAPRSAQSASGSAVSRERGLQSPDGHGALLVCGLVTVIQRRVEAWSRPTAGTPARRRPGPGCRPNRRRDERADLARLRELARRYAFAEPTLRRLDVPVLVARDEFGRQVGAGSRQAPSACSTRGSPRARAAACSAV